MKMLYTWGYATRTVKDLIALVHQHNIMVVVDVRRDPHVKCGDRFSEDELRALLDENKIKYICSPALSNTSRSMIHVLLKDPELGFSNLNYLLKELGNVLLLCSEKDPKKCHRSYIARMMTERGGVPVVHL